MDINRVYKKFKEDLKFFSIDHRANPSKDYKNLNLLGQELCINEASVEYCCSKKWSIIVVFS